MVPEMLVALVLLEQFTFTYEREKMKKYAVLNNGSTVSNIIVASSLDVAEQITSSFCVLVPLGTFVDIGYTYADGVFIAPVVETPTEETPAEETPA